ncbi:MAG TPA: AAA family ATPase, partial [Streptosporangiaceae bacterium]
MAGVLIERAGFLASLEGLLGEALDGSGRLVFLGGEAGVGKTTLAAARAARLGAHREAAEQFRLALRHHEPPDRQRAALLERLSYECYLTDQLMRARDSLLEALAIYEREGDARSVGTSHRWLSRLSW